MQRKEKGLVVKNEKTGKWELKEYMQFKDNTKLKLENGISSKCIACGRETDGYYFCKECYYKYKEKTLLIKITKCNDIEILDDSYEGIYKTKDGHIVKSKNEREIDDYLFERGIKHSYEQSLAIDEYKEHDLHPDFTLPEFDNGKPVYIEFWGYNENNIKYTNSKKYKIKKYKKLGITLICLNEKEDSKDIYSSIERKLKFYKPNQINYEN